MSAEKITTVPSKEQDHGNQHFSKLEASFATTTVVPRQNSIEMKDVWRHAQDADMQNNDLDFHFAIDDDYCNPDGLSSLQDFFPAAQYQTYQSDEKNFSKDTNVKVFDASSKAANWVLVNDSSLRDILENLQTTPTVSSPGGPLPHSRHESPERLLVLFVPLVPAKETSFGSRVSMTKSGVDMLFSHLNINSSFLPNLLGRPDYWAPQSRQDLDSYSNLSACDFFCQHPRWNLQMQGAPLSVYMRYESRRRLTTYIISHKSGDSSIDALQRLMTSAAQRSEKGAEWMMFLNDPYDIAVILSALSFEASKHHVKRFQRYMWTQINKVDDHLAGLATAERSRLGELTKSLQIISQQANSHLLNADVAIITAKGIKDAHKAFHGMLQTPAPAYQRAADTISYVIKSVEKQKMLFTNYQSRKDGTMSLVFNLVTQFDAANNIELAASMKQDSTSMKAIAALTMVFLPGTFTASVLSAGIFSSVAHSKSIAVSGIWWLWVAITLPLTAFVIFCWTIYKRQQNKIRRPGPASTTQDDLQTEEKSRPKRPSMARSLSSFAWSRKSSTNIVRV